MVNWAEVSREVPEFAAAVQARFESNRHKILATLRKDGSPRVSGVETTFAHSELWLGMMPDSRKGDDLRRDPRLALHTSGPGPDDDDPSGWAGDAKIGGRAAEVTDREAMARFAGAQKQMPPGAFDLFAVDITEMTFVRVGDPPDHLVIESWEAGKGLRRKERK